MGEVIGADGHLTDYQFDLYLIEPQFEQDFFQSIVSDGFVLIGWVVEALPDLLGVLCDGVGASLDDCLLLLLWDGLVVLDDLP